MTRRRRWIAYTAAAVVVLLAAAAWERRKAETSLAERRQVLERLVAEARASTGEGEARLSSGRWDLVAQVPSSVVERLLREFVGYRQRTRRGNEFVVRAIETRLHDGYAELRAIADFDWRLGLYDGPVEATYYAFARVTDEGGCDLFFRIAEMKTLAPWPLFNRFLEPILTRRMQRLLAIPNLRLPLGLARPPQGDGAWQHRFANGLEVTVPARPLDLGRRRVWPLLDTRRLGIVVERPAASPPPDEPRDEVATSTAEEVEILVRLDFFSERLERAVEPENDLQISLPRLERVWTRRTRGGRELRADLAHLRGAIDLRRLRLATTTVGLELDTEVRAIFSGQLEASVLQIRHAIPLRVTSSFVERLPLRLVADSGVLTLQADARQLSIPLEIESRMPGLPLRFSTIIAVPGESVARAARMPALVLARLEIPTRVEGGQVLESKQVPVEIEWTAQLPASQSSPLRARGQIHWPER